MADLAFVYHWTPETLENMDLEALMDYHSAARERLRQQNGG
jgi:hypothetical protein